MRTKILRRARSLSGEEGFSVVEVVAAVAVFSIMATAVAATLGNAFNTTRLNRHRSVAAHLASREMDIVRSTDFVDLPEGLVQSAVDVDGISYTVDRESAWISKNATTSPCDGASGDQLAFLRVTVNVRWPNMSGTDPVSSQTILTPPVGTYDRYTGHIAIKVFDRDATPAAGHVVQITGPENRSMTTSSDGCAFFAYLDPGDYNVALGTLGYVDTQGVTGPNQTAAVTIGNTTSLQFDYDREATLDLTLQGKFGGSVPADVAVTLGNTRLLPAGTKVFPGTGSPRAIGGLFPYLDGYQAWAGECMDADPEATTSGGSDPVYPGGQRDPALAVSPGATTAGTVNLATVDLLVVDALGFPLSGRTVTGNHGPDDGCPGGSTLTLGLTDAVGVLRVAMPYGQWEFQVSGGSPQGGTWPSALISPTDPTPPQVTVVVV